MRTTRTLRTLALAVLLLGGPAALTPPASAADIPDVKFNPATGHYYKLYTTAGTWSTARSAAQALGGYLVTLTSQAETDWVALNVGTGPGKLFIGATDEVTEGVFAWVSGEPFAWTNWNSGEPNNSGNEDYVEIYNTAPYRWNDIPASYSDPAYIVEWDENPNAPPPPVTPAAPTDLIAALQFDGTIGLSWTDNSSNESEFEVERMSDAEDWKRIARPFANVIALADLDLAPTTDYTYRVRAKNSVGPSDWSNEAGATSGTFVPSPKAPTDLAITSAGTATIDLQWTDNSAGEVGFEVHRSVGGAAYTYVTRTAPDATTWHETGLKPDTAYDYKVRAVGTLQASSYTSTSGATVPTLEVFTVKGDLKDSPKLAKDSLKLTLSWEGMAELSDGESDPMVEGFTLRAGSVEGPFLLKIPAGDVWKGKTTKWKWKSPKGETPKVQAKLDTASGVLSLVVKSLELPAPAGNPVRVSIVVGNDAGTLIGDWTEKKPGFLQIR